MNVAPNRPVVVSAKRFDAIMDRSRMAKKHQMLADMAEEQRYMQYLKDGSEALIDRFTNMGPPSLDAEKAAKLEKELQEAEIREKQIKKEDEQQRKERIMRANRILDDLKAGQRSLYHALMESEMSYARSFNEALNREIIEDGERQQRLDEQQCPEMLMPFCGVTEAEEQARQDEKAKVVRAEFLKDIAARREKAEIDKEQETYDCIVEREQYRCLHEEEKKALKERQRKSREFCRRAYKDALIEKAEIAKYNSLCDKINDRVVCVDVTAQRGLDTRRNKVTLDKRAEVIRKRDEYAVRLCRTQEAIRRKEQEHQEEICDRYADEVLVDEARRQCELEELRKQRMAYQLLEKKQAEERQKRDAQIRRFEVARRVQNQNANNKFCETQKRKKEKATAELRNILYGQREDVLLKRQEELMRIAACPDDPYLQQDISFFEDATNLVNKAKKAGRPIYPLAKAVERYRRDNQIDMVPEGRLVKRNKIRDYCWPGFHSKADLCYKNYAQREHCRQEEEYARHQIFAKCIKITKMAAEESPHQECVASCPIKCFHRRGMPDIVDDKPFECCDYVCRAETPGPQGCPSNIEVMPPCKRESDLQNNKNNSTDCPLTDNLAKVSSQPPCARAVAGADLLPSKPSNSGLQNRARIWR